MRYLTTSTSDGVTEREFVLGDIPGMLWSSPNADGPLLLAAHGGGQYKKAPAITSRAHRYVRERGFTVLVLDAPGHGDRPRTEQDERHIAEIRRRVARAEPVADLVAIFNASLAERAVPEWRAVLDALGTSGPAGFWGVSMGSTIGIPLVAAEPRITAAVFGLAGNPGLHAAAARIRVPLRFLLQWDDQLLPRQDALALFDAFGSREKSLHANPGGHGEVPEHEEEDAARFLTRHLSGYRSAEIDATVPPGAD